MMRTNPSAHVETSIIRERLITGGPWMQLLGGRKQAAASAEAEAVSKVTVWGNTTDVMATHFQFGIDTY